MNELFSSQQTLEIELFYKIEKTKNGQSFPKVITEKEYNNLKLDDANKDKINRFLTKWRMPTWQAHNELLEKSMVYNHSTAQMDLDFNKYRDRRLKSFLVDWDAKTSDGQEIPCNDETINQLHQNIAFALLTKYDEATRIDDEEEGKNS